MPFDSLYCIDHRKPTPLSDATRYEIGLIIATACFLPPMHGHSRHTVGSGEESCHPKFFSYNLTEALANGGKLSVFHVVYGIGELGIPGIDEVARRPHERDDAGEASLHGIVGHTMIERTWQRLYATHAKLLFAVAKHTATKMTGTGHEKVSDIPEEGFHIYSFPSAIIFLISLITRADSNPLDAMCR